MVFSMFSNVDPKLKHIKASASLCYVDMVIGLNFISLNHVQYNREKIQRTVLST